MGTLYVVATPIGNLEDITLRALRILKEVPLVAAEDTRVTRTLFRAHDIHTPLASFHEFTSPTSPRPPVERLDEGDVALVTDAGTPGVSDPGFPLIRDALSAGHQVVPRARRLERDGRADGRRSADPRVLLRRLFAAHQRHASKLFRSARWTATRRWWSSSRRIASCKPCRTWSRRSGRTDLSPSAAN